MRRIAVALLIGCWATLGCRSTTVSKSSPEPVARGATPKDESDHLRLAAEHLDRADEAGAVPHLKAHLRRQPDSLMVRAYLGELLLKTGNAAESKLEFEQFSRDAAGASGPAHRHLVHVHTRLMEIAGQSDDAFGEQLHRGIGLVLLVKQWTESGEEADAATAERTLVQAMRALKRAEEDKPGDARVWLYLAEAYAALEQPSPARDAIRKACRCQPEWTLNPHDLERLKRLASSEGL
jgi:tetratricopeptide (TPR) repeat protein